eukprot:2799336-Pleurochrysis_carterae.AAC.3
MTCAADFSYGHVINVLVAGSTPNGPTSAKTASGVGVERERRLGVKERDWERAFVPASPRAYGRICIRMRVREWARGGL